MGFLKKVFGGDAGITEAMYETYDKLKLIHPVMEEYEILALVLHRRFRKLPPEIALVISALFPRIEILTQWVIGLEHSGGPKHINEFLANTTTVEEREMALDYIQKKVDGRDFHDSTERRKIDVSEDVVDKSADVLWDKFHDRLNNSYDEDAKPLDHLSDELKNTVANIYYSYFEFCTINPTDCEKIEEKIEKIKEEVDQKKESWEMKMEAIITLTLKAFQNNVKGEYAAINHALEYLVDNHGIMPGALFTLMDDILISVFKYKIEDAYSRTGASLVAECKMREGESNEIPDLMNYFEYSWGYHFDNPYE